MDKKVYLSVDGGGTKVISLLFDEDLNFLADGKGGSINSNFTSMEDIESHMVDSIEGCLNQTKGIKSIECVWISMPGPFEFYIEILSRYVEVKSWKMVGEGQNGVDSAGISRGITAVCGTGSDAFYIGNDGKEGRVGGWGSPYGDDGSGYYIGFHAIKAAIASLEGWGTKTELEEAIQEFSGKDNLWDSVMIAYENKKDTRRYASSLCPVVEKCALNGDQVAIEVLQQAGRIMAIQVESMIRKFKLDSDLKLVTVGGVWKEEKFMRAYFIKHLQGFCPDIKVIKPLFEPIIGPVVKFAMGDDEEISVSKLEILNKNFSKYIFI